MIRSLCKVSEKVQGEVVEVLSQHYSYCLNKLTKCFTREDSCIMKFLRSQVKYELVQESKIHWEGNLFLRVLLCVTFPQ